MSDDFVAVFAAGDEGMQAVACSLLDEALIKYYIHGGQSQDLIGMGRIGGYNPFANAKIMVASKDAEAASEILRQLDEPDIDNAEDNKPVKRFRMPLEARLLVWFICVVLPVVCLIIKLISDHQSTP